MWCSKSKGLLARSLVAIAVGLSAWYSCFSSTALVQGGSRASGQAPLSAHLGPIEVAVIPIRTSPALTVAVLADTLDPQSLEVAKKDLNVLFQGVNARPFRLVVVQAGELTLPQPITSRARLQLALSHIIVPDPHDTGIMGSLAPVDSLLANAPRLGDHWSNLLIVGELPVGEDKTTRYAQAMVASVFGQQHVRVHWLSHAAGGASWTDALQATGGSLLAEVAENNALPFQMRATSAYQLDWASTVPKQGFVVTSAIISLGSVSGEKALEIPEVNSAAGFALPSLSMYSHMESSYAEAIQLAASPQVDAAASARIRTDLAQALSINPSDPDTLRTAATIYAHLEQYPAASGFASTLTEVYPDDGAAWALLGRIELLGSHLENSEIALNHAIALKVRTAQLLEDFAKLRIAQNNDAAAVPLLGEVLQQQGNRQDLWFLQAAVARRIANSALAIRSYEQGLALGGFHTEETGSLLELYAKGNDSAKLLALTTTAMSSMPADATIRSQFAMKLEEVKLPDQALAAWKRVLDVDPESENAYAHLANLELSAGDLGAALDSAEHGLEVAPKSSRLYIVKSDALLRQGNQYGARATLQLAQQQSHSPELLARIAVTEDTYGFGAPQAYMNLTEVLSPSDASRLPALIRGFKVSLRDNDLVKARVFADTLLASGHPEYSKLLGGVEDKHSQMLIPGGVDALAFIVHSTNNVTSETFLLDYCRAGLLLQLDPKSAEYRAFRSYFSRIAELESLGVRHNKYVIITLSNSTKESRRTTEKVLNLLGISMIANKGSLTVTRAEKKGAAQKQDTISALAIDDIGMADAFKNGKPYDIRLQDDLVPIFPNEDVWNQLLPAIRSAGGFLEAIPETPRLAHLYIALNTMDRQAANDLISSETIRGLYDRYAEMLYRFAPAFALHAGHAVVPGGAPAESLWAAEVGASPATPQAFYNQLLRRDDGKMLGFFYALSQLDRSHQLFYTASETRLQRFYKQFLAMPQLQHGIAGLLRDVSVTGFLRSVPLDADHHVLFPGSPEVWSVAKGKSANEAKTTKLLKKATRRGSNDQEDDVLLRLAQTRYSDKNAKHAEMDNFVAVTQIDAHRSQPLDDEEALLLAQQFSELGDAFSYFADLTSLDAGDLRLFAAAVQQIQMRSLMEANLQLGQLHALLEWLALLHRRSAIHDAEIKTLFDAVVKSFSQEEHAAQSIALLQAAEAIVNACSREKTLSADERLEGCLLGNATDRQRIAYRRVLEMQSVPKLSSLFAAHDAAQKLSSGSFDLRDSATILKVANELSAPAASAGAKPVGKEKQTILVYGPGTLNKTAQELSEKAAKRKSKDVAKFAHEFMGQLHPQLTLAFAGQVYAYFLRPNDLIVSEDPLLLRKHRYLDFSDEGRHGQAISRSQFKRSSEGIGSYFVGGFAQFALAAGDAASSGLSVGRNAMAAAGAQLAAVRAAPWDELAESDQRAAALRILVAKEWIVEAASSASAYRAMAEDTSGLLSPTRRATLLAGIEMRDWRSVWGSPTLSELFQLGGKYLDRYPSDLWPSAVSVEARRVLAQTKIKHLEAYGSVSDSAFGCDHTHFYVDAPYEYFEGNIRSEAIAERTAEFNLYLAFQADSSGIAPERLVDVAEALAVKALKRVQMSDSQDWQRLLKGFASITPADLGQALAP